MAARGGCSGRRRALIRAGEVAVLKELEASPDFVRAEIRRQHFLEI